MFIKLEFNKFFVEMSDATTADISNVELKDDPPLKLSYAFEIDGNNYAVEFSKRDITMNGVTISKNAYSIGFTGPNRYELTHNTKNPTAVYAELIKAVRKLIEVKNPDVLTFYSYAEPAQSMMYDIFYKRFLSKLYTRVGAYNYLRSDLYNKYQQENGPEWRAIQKYNNMRAPDLQRTLQQAKLQRLQARQSRVQPQT